jgi:hypothetical protein
VGVDERGPELGVAVPVEAADDGEMAGDVDVELLAPGPAAVPVGGPVDPEHAENSPTAATRASSAVRTILIGRPPH